MRIIPIFAKRNEANCYIVACGKSAAVIDPGKDAENIFNIAEKSGVIIEKILLTHPHFDHIMAVNELFVKTSAKLYIHKQDLSAIYEPTLNLSLLGAGVSYKINKDIPVVAFSDGDKIPLGTANFSVLSTPGHTPGSCCFIIDDAIFSGDTLFRGNIGRCDFPGGSGRDMKNSLVKLSSLPGDYSVFPGHGDTTTLDGERQYNYYMCSDFSEF